MKFDDLYQLCELSLKDYLGFAKKAAKTGLGLAKGAVGLTSAALRAPETIGKGIYQSVVKNEPTVARSIQRGLQSVSDVLGNTNNYTSPKATNAKQQSQYEELDLSPELLNPKLKRGDIVTGFTRSNSPYGRKRVKGVFLGRSDKGIMVANPSYV